MKKIVPTPPFHRVFICCDSVQSQLLGELERELVGRGITVVRGEPDTGHGRKRYSAEECQAWLRDADIAVMTIRHECSREFFVRTPSLRGLCFPVIGVESADIPAATEHGLAIAHGATPGNVIGMAEATIMLMLNLLYNLRDAEQRMRNGQGKPSYPNATALYGKTVGFVGHGRIAQAMAERLQHFGVNMLTYSPRIKPERLAPGVTAVELDTLMQRSDVVCVLVSITPESTGIIDSRALSLMKPGAYLINTARGQAVDEDALYRTLRDKRIAGAALDTFVQEPLAADSPLRQLDNVILTPHMVGQTRDARDEFLPAMLTNIERMLRGELPLYLKNTEVADRWLARWGHPQTA